MPGVDIKKNDEVEVIAGKDIGKRGRVVNVLPKENRVMVEGIARATKLEQSEGRRSLLQIRVDILRVVMQDYGKPTHIMYRANLSWNVLQNQLKSFIETGMLEVEEYGSRRKYAITEKGAEMVGSYQRVVDQVLG